MFTFSKNKNIINEIMLINFKALFNLLLIETSAIQREFVCIIR